jgi:hypothetical protein
VKGGKGGGARVDRQETVEMPQPEEHSPKAEAKEKRARNAW